MMIVMIIRTKITFNYNRSIWWNNQVSRTLAEVEKTQFKVSKVFRV